MSSSEPTAAPPPRSITVPLNLNDSVMSDGGANPTNNPRSTSGSALDSVSVAFLSLPATSGIGGSVYGRGSKSLAYSRAKHLALFLSSLIFIYAALCVFFLCQYRSLCAAGLGNGTKVPYDAAVSNGVPAVAAILGLVVSPLAAAAARLGRPAVMAVAAATLAACTALLAVFDVATFTIYGGFIPTRAAQAWAAMSTMQKAASYQNAVSNLEMDMKSDALAVAIAAMAGAILLGVATFAFLPHARVALAALISPTGGASDFKSLVSRCVALPAEAAAFDGAHASVSSFPGPAALVSTLIIALSSCLGCLCAPFTQAPAASVSRSCTEVAAFIATPCGAGDIVRNCFQATLQGQRRGRLVALTNTGHGAPPPPMSRGEGGGGGGAGAGAEAEAGTGLGAMASGAAR